MNAREMHYDFKQKLNEIDSQKYRNLKVPEIDWNINEGQDIFCKMIAEPRLKSQLGFEKSRRTIDDIRTIVVDQILANYGVPIAYDNSSFIVKLPEDYWFLINLNVLASKGLCKNVLLYDSKLVQHDDRSESSIFNKSNFEWRVSNYRFNKEGIRFFTDGTFEISRVGFEYLKQPKRIHNAQDWIGGTYTTLDGTVLTGSQDCELPVKVHSEIVDIAVMIASGNLNMPSYQIKQSKVKMNIEN